MGIAFKDNIVMNMESIAKSIVLQIKIVWTANFVPKMVHVNPDVQVIATVPIPNVFKINAWILVFKTMIVYNLIIVWKNYAFPFVIQTRIV